MTAGASDGANSVTVDYSSFTYIITDTTAIDAGTGCTQASSTQVNCASSIARQVTLNLADGADNAVVTANAPAAGRVTVNGESGGATVNSPNAVAAIHIDSSAGNFTTGYGADVLVVGGSGYTGRILTGGASDSVTVTTDLPRAAYDPDDPEDSPAYGGVAINDGFSWPVDIWTQSGGDYIDASASSGAVWYNHGSGCDLFIGGNGDDWASGGHTGTEDDTLVMGNGDDTIYAYETNEGDDMYYGQGGNDRLKMYGNAAEEMFDGGPGTDTLEYKDVNHSATMAITLDGVRDDGETGMLNDIFTSTVERVIGTLSAAGVTITGNADANLLHGGTTADTLTGGPGADSLYGMDGNDTLNAWDGIADVVNCGSGSSDVADVDSIDTVTGCESVTTH